jgi:hypothetical protein
MLSILNEGFRGFPQSAQANAGVIPWHILWMFLSTSCRIFVCVDVTKIILPIFWSLSYYVSVLYFIYINVLSHIHIYVHTYVHTHIYFIVNLNILHSSLTSVMY